jgi:hypothetical protein
MSGVRSSSFPVDGNHNRTSGIGSTFTFDEDDGITYTASSFHNLEKREENAKRKKIRNASLISGMLRRTPLVSIYFATLVC